LTNITWDKLSDCSEIEEEYEGFVYSITHIESGKVYFGIKKYWNKIRRKPLKGMKRVRLDKVECDWRTYKTSNTYLQKELEINSQNYKCEIIRSCKSVTEMKAWEAYYQLKYYVEGNWNMLFNEMINLRIRIRK
jgi:hypothetical protein